MFVLHCWHNYVHTPLHIAGCVQTTQRYTHCVSTTVRVQANYTESAGVFTKILRAKYSALKSDSINLQYHIS
jgi:hypothetical protein